MIHSYKRVGRLVRSSVSNLGFKQAFSVAVALLISLGAFAQDVVSGKVTDAADGSAIPGVSVTVKGTTKGAQTDINGTYKVNAGSGSTLVFTFVGYTSKEVKATGSVVNVSLAADNKSLEEVVVVGYGTQKRKEISGTVTSLGSREFNAGVVTNPLAAAQGKVAGLVITQSSGDPNSRPTVRLRGTGSLNAGSEPLYVIDGVIGAPIENVAPEDILSMDVLRDASSAAIYGSRGANGVILINTKRGKSGAPTVDYSAYVGAETISQRPELLNAAEFRAAASKYKQTFDDNGANTDWLDVITRTAVSQNHNVGVSGGSENLSYRASVGYLDQTGTLIGSGKDRLTGRLNLDAKALDGKLMMKFNMSAMQTNGTFSDNRAVGFAMNMRPTDPVYAANGNYFQLPGTFANFNPLAALEKKSNTQRLQDFLFNASAAYTILDGLVFNVSGTLRTQNANNSYFASTTPGNLLSTVGGNSASRSLNSVTDKQLEATLNWTKKLSDVSTLTLLGGYTYQDVVNDGFGAANNNFLTDAFGADNIGSGLGIRTNPSLLYSYKNEYKLVSFLARAQYSLMNKYFATVNMRRDGSTKFGDNNKWGLFPSVSVGWSLSEEAFLKGNTTIDNLKLRVSWGRTGNSEGIRPLLSKSFYGPSGSYYDGSADDFLPAYAIQSNPNPNLKWEINENYGAGIDFSILKGKLTGSIDWYTRQTKDLLYTVNAPQEKGYVYPTILANIGSMQNRGIEVSATYQWLDTQDWSISSTFAGSFNQNELIALKNDEFAAADQVFLSTTLGSFIRGTSAVNFSVLQAGQPVGVFYGAKIAKIENGRYVFQDLNGDGTVDPNAKDRTYLGDPNPKFVGGLTTNVRYKAFDLQFQFTGNAGAKIVNTNNLLLGRQDGRIAESNALKSALTSIINDERTIPMDYYVESGDHIRLNNASLGYTFASKGVFKRARVYVAGNNLLLFTNYSGVDPEVSQNLAIGSAAPGIDVRETYYKTRAFTAGINLSF
ncbi:SusC/RagA family TonB-linked outer membrane protein [Aquirufa antheringensis]|jgi:iron complex outermembrane receptor protein|uniref:SusC/RagA family TonB-linked outer membrane protein n=1 Tax=Aquirufa antheringensis TaxID=2516559 RepID=UPI001F92D83D|nr:SusC/RagA family TonB-linked outer membrane protein [Pseudarcicella sp. GAP-15]